MIAQMPLFHAFNLAKMNRHLLMQHGGWMVSDQETFFCWVTNL
jgi:hypothetical protein